MVDTRRLEKFMKLGEPSGTEPTEDARSIAPRKMLALSGHRELRQSEQSRVNVIHRRASIDDNWNALSDYAPDFSPDAHVRQFNLMARDAEITARFDVLRTQLVQSFRSRNLTSLGISAPRAGSGTSFVTAALIASLARRGDLRVIGLDLNLRAPGLHQFFEVAPQRPVLDLLSGMAGPETVLQRVTDTVAVAFGQAVPDLTLSTQFSADDLAVTLADLHESYAPDLIVCDLPPMLGGDLTLAMCTHLDAMLLIADSRRNSTAEMAECERLLTGQTEFLGIVLNNYSGGELV